LGVIFNFLQGNHRLQTQQRHHFWLRLSTNSQSVGGINLL